MAASATTRYYHGSSPGSASGDVIGSVVRHKQADNDTIDSLTPIPFPASGLSFGWRKSSKMNFPSTPAGTIANLRWFLGNNPVTGIRFFARVQGSGIYVQATSGDQSGITGFTDTVPNQTANDATNYTSSAPLTVNAGTVLSNPNTGEGTQVFVETQLACSTSYLGGPGPITSFPITYRYAET